MTARRPAAIAADLRQHAGRTYGHNLMALADELDALDARRPTADEIVVPPWDELVAAGVQVAEWDAYGTMFDVGPVTVFVDRRNDGWWDKPPEGWLVQVDADGERQRMTDHELRAVLAGLVVEHLDRLDPPAPEPQADDDVVTVERSAVEGVLGYLSSENATEPWYIALRAALDARGQR